MKQHLNWILVPALTWTLLNLNFVFLEPFRRWICWCVCDHCPAALPKCAWAWGHKLTAGDSPSGFSDRVQNSWFHQLWQVVQVLDQLWQVVQVLSLWLSTEVVAFSPRPHPYSLLCSLVSWETLSALLSKLKYYGLTGLLMQLTLSKLGFRGTWLPWRNVRSRLYDGAWERWRIVCLAALSVEDIDIYLFGTMITGILLIGLGFTLGYRRIQKTGTAVQSPTRLPVWLKLWEERSALRLRL